MIEVMTTIVVIVCVAGVIIWASELLTHEDESIVSEDDDLYQG